MKITGQEIFNYAKSLYVNSDLKGLENVAESCLANQINEVGWVLKIVYIMGTGRLKDGFETIDSNLHNILSISMAGKVGRCILDFEGYNLLKALQNQSIDRPDHGIWLYFGGCARMMTGNEDAAFVCFDTFRDKLRPLVISQGLGHFIEDENLNLILRQGGLCFGPEEVERRIARFGSPEGLPDFDILYPVNPSGPVFLSACNGLYYERFGYKFASRLLAQNERAVLYLHISDPQLGFEDLFRKLEDQFPGRVGMGITAKPPFLSATYFSCERFFVADFISKKLKCPIVTLDADITPTQEAPDFHHFTENYDFSCYETERNEPASICSAAVMAWGTGLGAKNFLQGVMAFCLAGDLENSTVGSWMLDQAAIYCVRNYFRKIRPGEVNFSDMRTGGITLDKAIHTFASDEEKQELRLTVSKMEKRKINI